MSTLSPTRDATVQTAVQDELEWTPEVKPAEIGVAVNDGVVSLSGEVDNYAEKLAATKAALRVRGVTAVVDGLSVHPKTEWPRTDTDIGKEVKRALRWASDVPPTVQAEIEGHHVTLRGSVNWEYQREAARRAVQYLRGVFMVTDAITLTERPSAADAVARIKSALIRNAEVDAEEIEVSVSGTKVVLTGTVTSWAEKHQAGQAAWASPHVTEVDNRIVVRAD